MKRLIVALALLTSACSSSSNQASSLTGPSVAENATPPGMSAAWDPAQLGRVVITASGPAVGTLVIWQVQTDGTQINVAQAGYTLTAGPNVVTAGLTLTCGTKYQRDFFVGVLPKTGAHPFTMSDLGNYPFIAPGGPYWTTAPCDIVPPPPPPMDPPCPAVQKPSTVKKPVDPCKPVCPSIDNKGEGYHKPCVVPK